MSIFSLQKRRDSGNFKRVLTVAVNNQSRRVTQARAKSNKVPWTQGPGPWEKLQAWAQQEDVMLARKI
jgi:hypothetical protein